MKRKSFGEVEAKKKVIEGKESEMDRWILCISVLSESVQE